MNLSIWDISDLLGLRKVATKDIISNNAYEGVFATGDFNCIFDYNVGLLQVNIKVPNNVNNIAITITTIDDGVWQGFAEDFSKVDIDKLAFDITSNFGTKLPTEEEFNKLLSKYNIFGMYTG